MVMTKDYSKKMKKKKDQYGYPKASKKQHKNENSPETQ